ncbi:LysR family transcriptional regulator [Myxococcus xanthus]|uniref:LysR family transcriptional regulator n=1 Tax=Myxococcus xanthus TaxID=34 RepID=A0AAE6KR58_MYXXA|nr:LysR family transcriptional regulator [Myxococcus xanthus]QDE66922.1 LysR family transcriptional regulator [Myxococcus xanthus]QDE74195.1 LysR family transcriptional regulator [Myxococcus xanthus]QDE81461.1 LysR family transcriptional regulator [Myxococcus xanthus]QDE95787.1 LysR family transcriptional regulator [Myxococcus xanthus]QDF03098.1 LysR family transcriptional regulator [Myxococcus xanthus]
MTSEQLRAFLEVARAGRLGTAARGLGLSQSGLSRQLQSLEAALGTRLLVRTPGGAVLTDAGERFLPHAQRALDALTAGTSELERLSGTPHGVVSLGTLHTVGAYLLPDIIPAFARQFPEVRPRLSEGLAPAMEEGVARGALDLAILSLPVRRADLVAQRLWEESLVLAVPRGHRLTKSGKPVTMDEVVEEPWVIIPGMSGTRAMEAACEARGVTPRLAVETDNAEAMRRMVERGLGVAVVPQLMARDHHARGFDVVPLARAGLKRQVALIHRGEGYLTAAARALKSFIVESVRAMPEPWGTRKAAPGPRVR